MGDRGNIVIKQHGHKDDTSYLYFYTHYSGSDMPETVQNALKRGKERWDDEQYLARIIFCELIKDDVSGLSGAGISTYMGDNEHDFIVVDAEKQTISRVKEGDPGATPKKSWSFEQFLKVNIGKEFGYDSDSD
jgi:hypothetical protein